MESHGKELILSAARQQLIEEGADSLSVRSVARRAHYSPAGLYRHFTSIEDLRLELVHRIAEEYRLMLAARLSKEKAPSARSIASYTAEWAEEDRNVAKLFSVVTFLTLLQTIHVHLFHFKSPKVHKKS